MQVSRHFELVNIPYIGGQTASISRFLLLDSSSRKTQVRTVPHPKSSPTSKMHGSKPPALKIRDKQKAKSGKTRSSKEKKKEDKIKKGRGCTNCRTRMKGRVGCGY